MQRVKEKRGRRHRPGTGGGIGQQVCPPVLPLLQSPLCAWVRSDKQQCWCRQALEQFHLSSARSCEYLACVSCVPVPPGSHSMSLWVPLGPCRELGELAGGGLCRRPGSQGTLRMCFLSSCALCPCLGVCLLFTLAQVNSTLYSACAKIKLDSTVPGCAEFCCACCRLSWKWNDICLGIEKIRLLFLLCRASQRLDQHAGQTDGLSSLVRGKDSVVRPRALSCGSPAFGCLLAVLCSLSRVGVWTAAHGPSLACTGFSSHCGVCT